MQYDQRNTVKKELEKRLNQYIENCSGLTTMKMDGYVDCYNDVFEIVGEMVEENRIKASARKAVNKFLGR